MTLHLNAFYNGHDLKINFKLEANKMSTLVPKIFKTKRFKKLSHLVLVFTVFTGIGFAGTNNLILPKGVQASSPVNIWWPTENANVIGTQPFKALLAGADISGYNMYWQVDGGQLNVMNNDYTDYPHKQALVDLSGWNWKNNGPYRLNFIAKDPNGNILGQQSSDIYVGGGSAPTTTVTTFTPTANVSPAPNSTINPISSTNSPGNSTVSTVSIDNWWPVDGASLNGIQPFKALIDNMPIDSYNIYWQVDGGQLNAMSDNWNAAVHKETSVDLSGWTWKGSGPYTITFVAKTLDGNIISQKSLNITVNNGLPQTNQPTPTQTTPQTNTIIPESASLTSNQTSNSNDPFAGQKLWVNAQSDAANYANNPANSSTDRQLMQRVATGAETQWFSTDWIPNMYQAIHNYVSTAQASGAMPTMVLYNIPFRDCGQYSAGGANDPTVYKQTVDQFAAGIGSAKAAVIIEPDALTLTGCLNSSQLQQRFDLLKYAVQKFANLGNTATYLDIGHPDWVSPQQAASLLSQAGVQYANGFSLNVSNFYTDQQNIDYGTQIDTELAKLGINGKHFIIDSGRNGNGSDGNWCNPSGRALGRLPTGNTGNPLVDAFLWVKGPGGSDGTCNGGPAAGVFWPTYALGLAQNAH